MLKQGRISARRYYDTYGEERVIGDVCDIRNNNQLKKLANRGEKINKPYWIMTDETRDTCKYRWP
jgi:hypothetical protein